VAYPDGIDLSWADGRGASVPDREGIDDVGFLGAPVVGAVLFGVDRIIWMPTRGPRDSSPSGIRHSGSLKPSTHPACMSRRPPMRR
jgi:hypothetical protein